MTAPRKAARRPRTASHGPPPGNPAAGAEDGATGRTDAPGGATVSDGLNRAADRGPRGQFAPGNKLASGNPQARLMQEYRRQFLEAINPQTIPMLARKLQMDALKGDEFAVRVLLDYALGKPAQAVELTGPDGTELGVNIGAITTVVLAALSGPEHAEARVKIAADLMRLDDARDADA